MNQNRLLGLVMMAMALLVIGCNSPTHVTGGGQLHADAVYPSQGGSFGFSGNSCRDRVLGQFNYVDHSLRIDGGVKFHGTVENAYTCEDVELGCGACALGALVIEGSYRSTNHDFSGEGYLTACMTDGGEGNGATDVAYLMVTSGPFAGYAVRGEISGNVQAHGCNDDAL